MSDGMTVKFKVHLENGRRTRKEIRAGAKAPPLPGRIPRISRLMALAIRFEKLLRDGVVADQAELAQLGHVTRARVTQIMNLLCLAPDIQEELLFLPLVQEGRGAPWERCLRAITRHSDWREQRRLWGKAQQARSRPETP